MSHKITRLAEPRSRELAIRVNARARARARIFRRSCVGRHTNFTAFPRIPHFLVNWCCCNTDRADSIIFRSSRLLCLFPFRVIT